MVLVQGTDQPEPATWKFLSHSGECLGILSSKDCSMSQHRPDHSHNSRPLKKCILQDAFEILYTEPRALNPKAHYGPCPLLPKCPFIASAAWLICFELSVSDLGLQVEFHFLVVSIHRE